MYNIILTTNGNTSNSIAIHVKVKNISNIYYFPITGTSCWKIDEPTLPNPSTNAVIVPTLFAVKAN